LQPHERLRVSKEARDPVGISSRFIKARGGFEPVEQIVRRQSVPLDRLRVAIGDLDSEFGVVLLADAGVLDAFVVSDAVDVVSVVVAVKAETMPVLKVPITMRQIKRTLAAENITRFAFILSVVTNKLLIYSQNCR